MSPRLDKFLKDESGATVVELVTLLAASFAVVLAAIAIIGGGVEDLAGETAQIAVDMDATQGFISEEAVAALGTN